MPLFDPRQVCVSPDELLQKTTNPRHIKMIKNYRLHALLEISGRWKEILQDDMIVENPSYQMFYMDQAAVLNGRDEVATFYDALDESGGTVFGPLEERMAVADWGIAIESHFAHHLRGHQLQAMGQSVDDPDGYYQLEHWLSTFWPYSEDGLLIGERVYENPATRTIREIDAAEFVTPEVAVELLRPLIEKARL